MRSKRRDCEAHGLHEARLSHASAGKGISGRSPSAGQKVVAVFKETASGADTRAR